MARSTGIPRRRGLGGISRIIGARTTAKNIRRYGETTNSLGETDTTLTSDHTVDLWLFDPSEGNGTEIVGERLDGALNGLCVADGTVDLEHNDRITHGGVEYEIDTIVGHPEDNDPDGTASNGTDFWMIALTRRQ